jgi:hypothetical protein
MGDIGATIFLTTLFAFGLGAGAALNCDSSWRLTRPSVAGTVIAATTASTWTSCACHVRQAEHSLM